MNKYGYSLLVAISFLAFNSCSNKYLQESSTPDITYTSIPSSSYGTYLAGRIAHYRQDFNSAANYYMKTAEKDSNNVDLLNKTYLMLASQGRIAEAAKYAEQARAKKDKNDFIAIIVATEKIKQQDYTSALKNIQSNKSPLYNKLITPFVEAWAYTGLKQYDKAIKSINKLQNQKGMEALYHFHAGMINDYFDKPDLARHHYESIINDSSMELSVRTLEVICNFYIRNGEKEKAVILSEKFSNTTPPVILLQEIHKQIKNAKASSTSPIISSPQIGLSEALFNISSVIKHNSQVLDFSHIFVRLSIYENPHNDLARILLASILEMREMYKEAISVYDEIQENSPAYYIAQYKKSDNLRNLEDYKGSELLLKSLIIDYPNDYQSLVDLGDNLRMQEKYSEALKYYNKAMKQHSNIIGNLWQIHYVIGITNERLGNWQEAEKSFIKALDLNPNNVLVLNYLGYSWLKQNKNPEQAFSYIINAYNQAPYNSSIIDSLGWAFYSFGLYNEAISYLEKAVDNDPSNAVINEHLGDAYWQGGRKNEARFQWNHALSLEDTSGEIDYDILRKKISDGMSQNQVIEIEQDKLQKIISQIDEDRISQQQVQSAKK